MTQLISLYWPVECLSVSGFGGIRLRLQDGEHLVHGSDLGLWWHITGLSSLFTNFS